MNAIPLVIAFLTILGHDGCAAMLSNLSRNSLNATLWEDDEIKVRNIRHISLTLCMDFFGTNISG